MCIRDRKRCYFIKQLYKIFPVHQDEPAVVPLTNDDNKLSVYLQLNTVAVSYTHLDVYKRQV